MSMSLSLGTAIPLDSMKLTPYRASGEELARLQAVRVEMYKKPIVPPDATYAEVKVGNKVVATLTNNGYVQTSNALSGDIRRILGEEGALQGPALAQQRAQKIADALGGVIVKAPTAQTQAQWNARPPVTWRIDDEALDRHGYSVPDDVRTATYASSLLASQTIAALLGLNEVEAASNAP